MLKSSQIQSLNLFKTSPCAPIWVKVLIITYNTLCHLHPNNSPASYPTTWGLSFTPLPDSLASLLFLEQIQHSMPVFHLIHVELSPHYWIFVPSFLSLSVSELISKAFLDLSDTLFSISLHNVVRLLMYCVFTCLFYYLSLPAKTWDSCNQEQCFYSIVTSSSAYNSAWHMEGT